MDWQIALTIVLGIIALYTLCFIGAILTEEWQKKREARKWQEWIAKGGK